MKTATVGVNLDSLMVRFSFMRDCGSIPHGDSSVMYDYQPSFRFYSYVELSTFIFTCFSVKSFINF